MIKLKLMLLCSVLFLTSCFSTEIYFHNTSNFDDGEIWGSDLDFFFIRNKDIEVNLVNERSIIHELHRVKYEVILKDNAINVDDGFYEYAFVFNDGLDTLYTNGLFKEWRYKNLKSVVSSEIEILLSDL